MCIKHTTTCHSYVTIYLFGFCIYSVPTESLSCHVVTSVLHLSGLCTIDYVQCMYTHVLYPHTLDVQCINFHAVMHYGSGLYYAYAMENCVYYIKQHSVFQYLNSNDCIELYMSGLNLAMAGQTSTYTDTLSVQLEKLS